MKTLKRMMVALLALLPFATGMAVADTDHDYDRIFIFGASLMDSGNHFAFTGETAHPPFELFGPSYAIGSHNFSNGRTWVQVLAAEMKLIEGAMPAYRNPGFGNYAMGYGRARDIAADMLPSLYDQVQAWKDNGYCTGAPMDDTLFIVDATYFDLVDLLNGEDALPVLMGMTTSIAENIGILYGCGARNLLFAYIPPLEASPIAPPPEDPPAPSGSALYNYMFLAPMIQSFAGEPFNMNVSVVDFFAFVNVMLATPDAFGLTNVTDSCVTFGVTDGAFCEDRDGYFLWDPLHPTRKVHALFAEFALGQLP
ncbi:MAG: SGNH/GDSL hydrolase family protein [Gammaproteobacteria bacterium]|nr:SGNH/GDSL hydrolase family protein [Gammaproteobacteria bacterium]